MPDSVYWIWFQIVFGIGTRRAELMMSHFSSPKEIYDGAVEKSLVWGMLDKAEKGRCAAAMTRAEEIKLRTLKKGVSIITPDHEDYPEPLKSIYTKPAVLYVKGDIGVLRERLAIGMVGTREITDYGKAVSKIIAGGLGEAGAVVISGLAPGIDTECHRAAIAAGGKSIGILGCGIDVDYPKGSAELKRLVCENGAVVTEYPLGTTPYAGNFPTRNRIISGMSHGVAVIEANIESGSLITANHALDQNRDIFAVPGSILSKTSKGTHHLISDGAKLVTGAEDILEEYTCFGFTAKAKTAEEPSAKAKALDEPIIEKPAKAAVPDDISPGAKAVYDSMEGGGATVEQIAAATGFGISKVLTALTELEIYNLVQALPGRKFEVL